MSIETILQAITRYLNQTRRVGHTTAMMEGAVNTKRVVTLAVNEADARRLRKMLPSATVQIATEPDILIGLNRPLVIDNNALSEICREVASEIRRLKAEIQQLTRSQDDP